MPSFHMPSFAPPIHVLSFHQFLWKYKHINVYCIFEIWLSVLILFIFALYSVVCLPYNLFNSFLIHGNLGCFQSFTIMYSNNLVYISFFTCAGMSKRYKSLDMGFFPNEGWTHFKSQQQCMRCPIYLRFDNRMCCQILGFCLYNTYIIYLP